MHNRLSIQLPHALDYFVRSKVLGGRYASVSEVIRDALRLMEDRDQILAHHQHRMWHNIAEGLAELCAAPDIEREAILDNVEARLALLEAAFHEAPAGFDPPFALPGETPVGLSEAAPRLA